jgi:membrane protease YdiL (CAAX protease family)
MAGYGWYVRKVERRAVSELSGAGAARELGAGAAIGAGLILLAGGGIYAAGCFDISGRAPWTVMIKPFTELAMMALFEELLFRGIVFRIAEKSLGSTLALLVSALVFAANFMSDAVFSLPTSGHPVKGLLQGRLSGPDWISGGAYGIEGSVVTLAVIGALTLGLLIVAARRGA